MKMDHNFSGAKILKKFLVNEEESAKVAVKIDEPKQKKMSTSAALNMCISRFLSKEDYVCIRKAAIMSENEFLPSWDEVSLIKFFV